MTEYELADAISSYAVQGGTFFTIWLTILSAYALVAYVVGKDLTSFQILWLNTLYLFTSLLAIFGCYGSWNSQVFYIGVMREMHPHAPQTMNSEAMYGIVLIAIAGTVTTLKFMWDVRHPGTK